MNAPASPEVIWMLAPASPEVSLQNEVTQNVCHMIKHENIDYQRRYIEQAPGYLLAYAVRSRLFSKELIR